MTLLVGLLLATLVPAGTAAASHTGRTSGVYADDDGSVHEPAIEALATTGITKGCDVGRFCPNDTITRGEMAAFLTRAVAQPAPSRDWFGDDDGTLFEGNIQRLAEGGHTVGCNPPSSTRFCPDRAVTRGEMAAFLVSVFALPPSDRDVFVDDDGSVFEAAIQSLRAGGVTLGCDPPANERFCPRAPVTRGQTATFLARAQRLTASFPSDLLHPVAMRWGGIDLRLPSSATELIGFHESNHDGARDLADLDATPAVVMESRRRGTGRRSAADLVSHPRVEIRAPVTGTVKRSGTYVLYCRYSDDFLVVEPDGHPGIEVKLLHIDGVRVGAGDRVRAGVTVVARGPTPLPFASQVDELSGPADWPHVHLEVVDTSIPDRPGGGSC